MMAQIMENRSASVQGFEAIELTVDDLEAGVKTMEKLLGHSAAHGTMFPLGNLTLEVVGNPGGAEGISAVRFSTPGETLRLAAGVDCPTRLDQLEAVRPRPLDDAAVEELETQPDRVYGLDHLVVRSRDVDATRDFYSEVLGLRVLFDREFEDWGVRLCMVRLGDAVLEIAGKLGGKRDGADSSKPDDAVSPANSPRDRLWGLTWRVGNADQARTRLLELGVDVSEVRNGRRPGTRVFTVRSGTCNVPTLFIEPKSHDLPRTSRAAMKR